MTAIIAIEKGDLNKDVLVDESILKVVGSSIYIEVGEKIKLIDLIYGMMLRSGNDAATMIAINIAGSMDKFKDLMNEYANKIGMKNTCFYNSHGLEEKNGEGNTASAYDMAILTAYAMKNKTFRKIFNTMDYIAKSDKKTYNWHNKNKLLKYDYITGGKTGYTIKAHRTLVTTATIDNMNLIIVTLNDSNDWQDHLDLYGTIKNNYININVLNKDKFKLIDDTIYTEDKLYIKNNVNITVKKSQINNLQIKYYLSNNNYKNNAQIGFAKIYLNDEFIKEEPIYLKVQKRTIFSKIKVFFNKLF